MNASDSSGEQDSLFDETSRNTMKNPCSAGFRNKTMKKRGVATNSFNKKASKTGENGKNANKAKIRRKNHRFYNNKNNKSNKKQISQKIRSNLNKDDKKKKENKKQDHQKKRPTKMNAVKLTNIKKNSITINWTPPENDGFSMIESFQIHTQIGEKPNGAKWKQIYCGHPDHNAFKYMLKDLLPSTTYHFRIRCKTNVGFSKWSNRNFAKTAEDKVILKHKYPIKHNVIYQSPEKSRRIVFGYLLCIKPLQRDCCAIFRYTPQNLVDLCILYYVGRIDEYFHKTAKIMSLSQDMKTITFQPSNLQKTRVTIADTANSNYGFLQIHSKSDIECKWTLQINGNHHNKLYQINVGIVSNKKEFVKYYQNEDCFMHSNYPFYCLIASDSKFKKKSHEIDLDHGHFKEGGDSLMLPPFGKKYGKTKQTLKMGDIIDVHLSLSKQQLIFYMNGISQGIAYDNIICDENTSYTLVVHLYGYISCSLLNFQFLN